jgi:hypothetical protein
LPEQVLSAGDLQQVARLEVRARVWISSLGDHNRRCHSDLNQRRDT